jgi:hypothetical protein
MHAFVESRRHNPSNVQPSVPASNVPRLSPVGHAGPQSAAHDDDVSPQSQRPFPHEPVLHATHAPEVLHQLVVPPQLSGLDVQVQPVVMPAQTGVAPEHAEQVGPHAVMLSHVTHVPPVHVFPLPQSEGAEQSLQTPATHPPTHVLSVGAYVHVPVEQVPVAANVRSVFAPEQ